MQLTHSGDRTHQGRGVLGDILSPPLPPPHTHIHAPLEREYIYLLSRSLSPYGTGLGPGGPSSIGRQIKEASEAVSLQPQSLMCRRCAQCVPIFPPLFTSYCSLDSILQTFSLGCEHPRNSGLSPPDESGTRSTRGHIKEVHGWSSSRTLAGRGFGPESERRW